MADLTFPANMTNSTNFTAICEDFYRFTVDSYNPDLVGIGVFIGL